MKPLPQLTPRQRQVAALKRHGAANKEIAGLLGIAEATVKSHTKKIYEIYRDCGYDLHLGSLVEQNARMRILKTIAHRAWKEATFGLECGVENA